uniref:Reverse transcriptase domain-containing protein n=1 Tax=Clytia hemisphaerica TaxID=252671 RepID=A0A7M5XB23_9CNID
NNKPEHILDEDYATVIRINTSQNTSLLLIGVYLQSVNQSPNLKETYNAQLSALSGVISHFEDISDIVIFGDFQSCPQTFESNRLSRPNVLSDSLDNFLDRQALTPTDITHGTGPLYTYSHLTLDNKSYIDHICISPNLTQAVSDTKVLDPHHLNTGDHLPVTTTLKMYSSIADLPDAEHTDDNDFVPTYLWTNKIFTEKYQKTVNDAISEYKNQGVNIENDILFLHQTLKESGIRTASELRKDNSFHKINPKPWWNNELSKKKKTLQTMFNAWKEKGFTKDTKNTEFNRYKLARRDFRILIKTCKNQATAEHYVKLDKIKHSNPKSYWKNIRLAKGQSQKLYTINGKTSTQDINQEFKNHFDKLLNTPRIHQIDNNESNTQLQHILEDLINDPSDDFHVINTEVQSAIKELNKNKTTDPYSIKADHYLHAVDEPFLSFITQLINDIIKSDVTPTLLATSHIVPVIKSYRKPLSDPNNYRGISLIPIITKLIEKLILLKCPNLKNHQDAQFGFTSDGSTTHAELLLRETISKYNNENTPVYMCSLDAEKAFDCCNWLALFQHLIDKTTLPKQVTRFLIDLYLKGEANVKYRNHFSDTFRLSQGVRQGSILSPYLYNLYTEEIIENIHNLKVGTQLEQSLNTSIIVFADDIILLSPTLKQLQIMIDTCFNYGQKKGIKFNTDKQKTQFLISGKHPFPNPTLNLNGETIHPQTNLKHLGFQWSIKSRHLSLLRHFEDRVSELWAVSSSLISCGIRKLHPSSIVTLFKSIVIPKVLYGLEITNLNVTQSQLLDRQLRSALKSLMGLSKHSTNELLKYFNLTTVTNLLKQRKINLVNQLMKNPMTSSYLFSILSQPNRSHSLIQDLLDTCQSEGINVIDLLLSPKKHKLTMVTEDSLDLETETRIKNILENWSVIENRQELKNMLTRYI